MSLIQFLSQPYVRYISRVASRRLPSFPTNTAIKVKLLAFQGNKRQIIVIIFYFVLNCTPLKRLRPPRDAAFGIVSISLGNEMLAWILLTGVLVISSTTVGIKSSNCQWADSVIANFIHAVFETGKNHS